jgi:putative hemolysin
VEYAWAPFVGKLARLPGVTVVPVYFHGQNSRTFQILSHTNYALRIALLFRESVRRMGSSVKVSVGEPITPETLADLPDRTTVIAELRRATLALGGPEAPSPELEFKFPKHVYSD